MYIEKITKNGYTMYFKKVNGKKVRVSYNTVQDKIKSGVPTIIKIDYVGRGLEV